SAERPGAVRLLVPVTCRAAGIAFRRFVRAEVYCELRKKHCLSGSPLVGRLPPAPSQPSSPWYTPRPLPSLIQVAPHPTHPPTRSRNSLHHKGLRPVAHTVRLFRSERHTVGAGCIGG